MSLFSNVARRLEERIDSQARGRDHLRVEVDKRKPQADTIPRPRIEDHEPVAVNLRGRVVAPKCSPGRHPMGGAHA
jgi:hypothetical protein